MSDELRRKLQLLEDEYPGQPLVAQQVDLQEINRLRSQLGLPLVDAKLHEIGTAAKPAAEEKAKPEPKKARDHSKAREIYQAYLKKIEELAVHQAYAEQVAKATAGRGQTPVRPLATMGTNGGPLLCDHCGKPIILEGGEFHGVPADAAWRKKPRDNWMSWILGGMVVEIQSNDTLRIYHGYPGANNNHCCNVASRNDKKARAAFQSQMTPELPNLLLAYFEDEFPDKTGKDHLDLLNKVLDTMYSYDPGIGVNRPSTQS